MFRIRAVDTIELTRSLQLELYKYSHSLDRYYGTLYLKAFFCKKNGTVQEEINNNKKYFSGQPKKMLCDAR